LGLCFRPDWRTYSALADPLAVFKGLLLNRRGRKEGEEGKGKARRERKEGRVSFSEILNTPMLQSKSCCDITTKLLSNGT